MVDTSKCSCYTNIFYQTKDFAQEHPVIIIVIVSGAIVYFYPVPVVNTLLSTAGFTQDGVLAGK